MFSRKCNLLSSLRIRAALAGRHGDCSCEAQLAACPMLGVFGPCYKSSHDLPPDPGL